jgi:pimeloyl-ACP methyl ester carboxylesterase
MQKSLTFKNATISFSDQGTGTAVVLIHGFLENAGMWKNVVSEISKRNRIITIDLLGHGKTDCLGYINTMELFAETIAAVLKELRIRKCILVGHSLGGYIALAFAEKHPQKVKGLCLMNATSNEDTSERKALRLRANKMIANNFRNVVRMSFANLFGPKSKTIFKEEIELAISEALQTSMQGYMAAQEGMRIRVNRNHVLTENSFKKLLIIGKKDPVLDFETSLDEAEKTNSAFVVFENGHMPHIEDKLALNDALKEFIKIC